MKKQIRGARFSVTASPNFSLTVVILHSQILSTFLPSFPHLQGFFLLLLRFLVLTFYRWYLYQVKHRFIEDYRHNVRINRIRRRIDESKMGEIQQYQHHQPPEQSEQSQQPQPVFEQWQQQTNFQFFNHANLQYNYNNYNYHPQQQPQQIFPQFQNIQTNHHGISPCHLHFHPQQNLELEQQQRRLQLENTHDLHYQQPFFSRDNNNNNNNHNNNNSRGFIITGDGSSIIPIPSTPSYLNGNFRCRNDNDVTAFRFTSLARPSHFWYAITK